MIAPAIEELRGIVDVVDSDDRCEQFRVWQRRWLATISVSFSVHVDIPDVQAADIEQAIVRYRKYAKRTLAIATDGVTAIHEVELEPLRAPMWAGGKIEERRWRLTMPILLAEPKP